jgi:exopolysaccharide biosynthesis polyprenyl glycosylphosphotransferase
VDEVIIATPDAVAARIAVRVARRNQLDVTVVPDLHGEAAFDMECIEGVPMLKISEQQYPEWNLALKRFADIVLAAAGLAVLAPLLAAVAVLIKIDSAGPVFYRAIRVGRKGRRFNCYKLRTMVSRADELKSGLRLHNQREGAFFKVENDPRVTRVGRYLRRYSIDELPQLWNVLRGEMSLVGPRPHPTDDVERYEVADLRRLDFVPGITGLWQVTARRDPSFKRSVELDVEYITRWSMLLDFKILCRTIGAVLQGSGA